MDSLFTSANFIIFIFIFFFLAKEIYTFLSITFILNRRYSSLATLLQEQKTIRLVTDNTPGYGNLAATMNILERLRHLGFKGKFEFIYPDNNAAKIITLFELPTQTLTSVYYHKEMNIKFIALTYFVKHFQPQLKQRLLLGCTGAYDEIPERIANFATYFNVKHFIKWDPFINRTGDTFLYRYRQDKILQLKESYKKCLLTTSLSLPQLKNYFREHARGKEFADKHPCLFSFIEALEEENINFYPLYGYPLYEHSTGMPSHMLEVILGARYAQLCGKKVLAKPLIIGVFYEYQKEAALLSTLLNDNDWRAFAKEEGIDEMKKIIHSFKLSLAFKIGSLTDKNLTTQIEQLAEGDILLLSMGKLPKKIFDSLFTHTASNIFPPVREGANSLNHLLQTGRPHIRCTNLDLKDHWEIGYELASSSLTKRLNELYQRIFRETKHWKKNEPYQWIGEFIIDAFDPESELSEYFSRLRAKIMAEDDKVIDGLNYLLKM